MTTSHLHPPNYETIKDIKIISTFPPTNLFLTPRINTPEPIPSNEPQRTSSPSKQSRTPRKGSFTEVFSSDNAPLAYSSILSRTRSASPPVSPKGGSPPNPLCMILPQDRHEDFAAPQMPERASRSVSPVRRHPDPRMEASQGTRLIDREPFIARGTCK